MKCFVTGAAGFIGSHLCDRLIGDGHEVIGLDDLSNGKLSNLDQVRRNPGFHMLLGDVVTGNIIDGDADIKDIDWFFHLAAKADIVPSIERPADYHNVNVNGTVRALESARKMNVKKFIYAASSSCYGIPNRYPTDITQPCNPQYPYALSKLVGELYAHHWGRVYDLPVVSLRLFNVYGPRHRTSGAYGAVFGVFLSQLANQAPLTVVGKGDQLRDFTFVTDVVDAFVRAAETKERWPVYNVGSGKPKTINRLIELLGGKDRIELPLRPGEPPITHADIDVTINRLGWKPKVSFEEGIAIMRDLIPQFKDAPLWTKEKIEEATKPWFKALA